MAQGFKPTVEEDFDEFLFGLQLFREDAPGMIRLAGEEPGQWLLPLASELTLPVEERDQLGW